MFHFAFVRCFDLLLGPRQDNGEIPPIFFFSFVFLSFFVAQPKEIDNLLAPFKVAKGLVVTGPRLNLEGAQQQTHIEQMTYRLITYVASGS
jgi:hypothetical protein